MAQRCEPALNMRWGRTTFLPRFSNPLTERETGLNKVTPRAASPHLAGRPVSIRSAHCKKEGYHFGYPSLFARARDGTRTRKTKALQTQ